MNGRLTFLETAPKLHLRSKYIFVRAGELLIGSETKPFAGEAQITLYGEKESEHIVYENAVEAGNKIIANTNIMKLYGQKRIGLTRLLQSANKGDSIIYVEAGLSWKAGDKIGLAPTRVQWKEQDYGIIATYDNSTGMITLDRPLTHFHWGASKSTGGDYSGVDMRGEVVLLSRNIKIVGEDVEAWGCQVLTGDFIEGNGEFRYGHTIIDSVEIYNCSQYDTHKAALRFQEAYGSWSSVSNSAIHHGLGFGLQIETAANLIFTNNTFFDFVKYGFNVVTAKNVTVDGNFVGYIHSRHLVTAGAGDPQGAFLACAHLPNDKCYDLKFINNIAAGVEASTVDTVGFSINGNECGDYKTIVFKNNVAHSIQGNGATIFKNWTSDT